MFPSFRFLSIILRWFGLMAILGVVLVSCSPTVEETPYDKAKDAFKRGQLDRAVELTDNLATTTPPGDFTERARVLRAVIFTGELKSKMELADAYGQGFEKAEKLPFRSEFRRVRMDNLQAAAQLALNLAETAHQLAPAGVIAKELTLEASFPNTEGPAEVKQLADVKKAGKPDPGQEEIASRDSLRKSIDDTLAEVVEGDRSKARTSLAGGSTKLDGTDFALFLSKGLVQGALAFDRKHAHDAQKLRTICGEGQETLKAALDRLKDQPDKNKEAEVKKLQDKFKGILKDDEQHATEL
jgi:hypothetical protein